MKQEARRFRQKAIASLILAIELFNRPTDRGRLDSVLIMLAHAFEMLLKAIVNERTKRSPATEQPFGTFREYVNRCRDNVEVKCLNKNQALVLQILANGRNAAQHALLEVPEQLLYYVVQSGVKAFRNVHDSVFDASLLLELPERILPVSTSPPIGIAAMFDREVDRIRSLLKHGNRRGTEVLARVRGIAMLETAVQDKDEPTASIDIEKLCKRIGGEESWSEIFPGVSALEMISDDDGPTIQLRLTRRNGVAVRVVGENETPDAVVVERRVKNEDRFNLSPRALARHVGLSPPKCRAVVDHIKLRNNDECYYEFQFGASKHPRYSQKAIQRIRAALAETPINDIWKADRARRIAGRRK